MYSRWNNYVTEPFISHIDRDKVKIIFEIGARECQFTGELLDYYNKCEKIYSFECNPLTIEQCIEKTKNDKRIVFNAFGISEFFEKMPFHVTCTDGDFGFSSVFMPTGHEKNIIGVYDVPCMNVDSYCTMNNIKDIDLVAMDIEGNELNMMKGSIFMLPYIRYIICEVQDIRRFDGGTETNPLRSEITDFLKDYGFVEKVTTCNGYYGDSLYVNERML